MAGKILNWDAVSFVGLSELEHRLWPEVDAGMLGRLVPVPQLPPATQLFL